MYQQESQESQESSAGGHSRPATCYNCGANDHFLPACPEPVREVPAGLAAAHAARAAKAANSLESPDIGRAGYSNRPYKRQKTGPIVTRYPAPVAGPIVTHYSPPPNQGPPHGEAVNQGYYGSQSMQSFGQQVPFQTQPYPHPAPPQQNITFAHGPYPGPGISQSYSQPGMPMGPRGYNEAAPFVPSVYVQPSAQAVPQQYEYQAQQTSSYPNQTYHRVSQQQQHGYDSSTQYGLQLQNHQYHGQPPFQGQPPQQHRQYQVLSHDQTAYHSPAPSQEQQPAQGWAQPPQVPQAYTPPGYQTSAISLTQPYQKPFQKPPHRQQQFQPTQYGTPNNSQAVHDRSAGLPAHQKGYTLPPRPHRHSTYPNKRRASRFSGAPQSEQFTHSEPGGIQPPEAAIEGTDQEWDSEHAFLEIVQPAPDPIAHPLPTVYDEEPILPPAYDAKAITSKFVRPNNREIFSRDIRSSLHWPNLRLDPAFSDINFNSPLVPFDEIGTWLHNRYYMQHSPDTVQWNDNRSATSTRKRRWSEEQDVVDSQLSHEVSLDNSTAKNCHLAQARPLALRSPKLPGTDRAVTPSLKITTGSSYTRSGTPSFGADDDAWAPQPGEGQIMKSPAADPTEALLASLGVTGSPKPVRPKPLSYSSSKSYRDDPTQDSYGRNPVRQDSGYVSARGSYSAGSSGTADNLATYGDHRQPYNGKNPPPPPPPPLHMRRQVDGPNDSPSSDGSGRGHSGMNEPFHDANCKAAHQGSSPSTPTSTDVGVQHGSMSRERQDCRKSLPLRQEDDVTPKLKRRQPKVADAYSRRW